MGGYGKGDFMAEKLAEMHKVTSPNGKFGWFRNNTIGKV